MREDSVPRLSRLYSCNKLTRMESCRRVAYAAYMAYFHRLCTAPNAAWIRTSLRLVWRVVLRVVSSFAFPRIERRMSMHNNSKDVCDPYTPSADPMRFSLRTAFPARRWFASQASAGRSAPKGKSDTGVDYGKTMLLPNTAFPMRARASEREPGFLDRIGDRYYRWQMASRSGKPFVFHDGPPYANGDLHMGHALNKIVKDITSRFQSLRGRPVYYRPGWDCHGLPIELAALKGKADSAKAMQPIQVRRRAQALALNCVERQKKEFIRWGVMGEWERPYLTLLPEYEAEQIAVFQQMWDRGIIFRGERPVHWSPTSSTALAEAELEYPDVHHSKSVFVTFPLNGELAGVSNAKLCIWTTTPWTLLANRAVCVNKSLDYSVVKFTTPGDAAAPPFYGIVAADLLESVSQQCGLNPEVIGTVRGDELVGRTYQHPLLPEAGDLPIIFGDHVTTEQGTGMVHTAPGHGHEDFHVAKDFGLPVYCPVDGEGKYTKQVGPRFAGMSVLGEGNEEVITALGEAGILVHQELYEHRYPYDWRTKKPVIIRTTQQWFADVRPLHKDASDAIVNNVEMIPQVGTKRLTSMVEGREQWCISRQRCWGVPIPVFYDIDSGEAVVDHDIIEHVRAVVAKHGSDAWWTMETEDLLPPSRRSQAQQLRRGADTLDVWFDSGCSWAGVLRSDRDRGLLPIGGSADPIVADVYLEGSDQHRGWFQSSLLTSIAVQGCAPYRKVVTHGFLLDEQGRKMSKSIGNTISPKVIVDGGPNQKKEPAYGADVLRLWAASGDFTTDVQVGPTLLKRAGDMYRKIRNTMRFLLGNLSSGSLEALSDPHSKMSIMDEVMIERNAAFRSQMASLYDTFQYAKAMQLLQAYVAVDLSSFYLDVVKDRLYAGGLHSAERLSCQRTLTDCLFTLTLASSPVLCYLTQDVFEHMPAHVRSALQPASISKSDEFFTPFQWSWTDMPLNESGKVDCWTDLLGIRDVANRAVEQIRAKGEANTALEMKLELVVDGAAAASAPQGFRRALDAVRETGADFFVCSELVVTEGTEFVALAEMSENVAEERSVWEAERGPEVLVRATPVKATAHKCPRCWKWTAAEEDGVCHRCAEVLDADHDLGM